MHHRVTSDSCENYDICRRFRPEARGGGAGRRRETNDRRHSASASWRDKQLVDDEGAARVCDVIRQSGAGAFCQLTPECVVA